MRDQLIDPTTPWGKGIIERNPNILNDLADIERRYAKFNDNFTRDIAGKIIRKLKGSGKRYEVGDEGVIKRAIMNDNPEGRKTLRAILNTPEGLEGLEAIRSAIKGMYRQKMGTATGDTSHNTILLCNNTVTLWKSGLILKILRNFKVQLLLLNMLKHKSKV